MTGAVMSLLLAMPVAAQISTDPINNRGVVRNALAEMPGASSDAEPAQPPQAGTTGLPNTQVNPMAATSGGLGLFTLETGELLESGWSFSVYGNRFTRMPGSVVVSNYGLNFGLGFRKWVNLYAAFQPEVATQIGNPGELSLRTPPDVMAFPPFGSTIYRTLGPGKNPGYVEDFPFAARNDSGPGNVTLGVKFALLSERAGAPVTLSIRNDVIIPTRYTLTQLLGNGTQTGEVADQISVASSRHFGSLITLVGNFGYLLTRDPRAGGARDLTQADQVHLGTGFILFPEKRIQFMSEYNGLVFAGAATPNSTFGARDPIDGIWGLRIYVLPQAAIDVGYRYMLNLSNATDRSGFVIKLGITNWPF
jgi:hypothetical protein